MKIMMALSTRPLAQVFLWTVLFATVSDCQGETKTWTPFFGSDDWQFGANWDPSGEPSSIDDVIIDVTNDLVVLNDDTTLVDSILLVNGADIRTNGHTLNLNDTGNSSVMTIGNGVNLSRLELDPAAGKSADVDVLQINNGGQLDMDGGVIEIDSQLVMNAGAEIFGFGTINYDTAGGVSALLGGEIQIPLAMSLDMNAVNGSIINFGSADVIVGAAGTLSVTTTGGQVDMEAANFLIGPGATASIDSAILGAHSGTVTLTDSDSALEVTEAWTLAGDLRMSGPLSGDRDVGIVRGGAMTVTGTIELEDASRLRIQSRATFAASAEVIIDDDPEADAVSAEVVIEAPAVLAGASFRGDGTLVAKAGLTVSGETFFSTDLEFDLPNPNLTGLTITNGASFTYLGSSPQPPNTILVAFEDIRIEMEENTSLRKGSGDWKIGRAIAMADGATIIRTLGAELQMQGILTVTSGEAVIETDVDFNSTGGFSGIIQGFSGTTLRLEGDTIYRAAETQGSDFSIIQNGDGRAQNGSLLEAELFAIAGSDGETTDFEFRLATTGDTTIAGGAGSVGVVNATGDWDVNGSLYVGGTRTTAAGAGTLNVGPLSGDGINSVTVQEALKVYTTGTVNVDGGDLTTDNLIFDSGASFLLIDGAVTVEGGVGRLPDSSFAFGGGAGDDPEFNARNGADVAVTSRWTIGDVENTSGRTEVTGLGPLNTPSTLRSTGGGSNADLRVGNNGHGELLIAGGGLVDFQDDITIGRQATGFGAAIVDGVHNGVRSTMRATTSGSIFVVGSLGTGTLDITDGARVESDRFMFIAQTPGSTGQVHLYQTNSPDNAGFDSELFVGDDLVVGGGFSNGGFGTLIIDEGGRVEVVEALIIRSDVARMTVSGGEFDVGLLSHTQGGALQLHSGRGVIANIDTNADITIGDGVSPDPMELVVSVAATSAPFRDVAIASNGVLNLEGAASADDLMIATGGKLHVAGRLDLEVLTDGSGNIELASGTLAVNDSQPNRVSHDFAIDSNGTIEVAGSQTLTLAGTVGAGGDGGIDNFNKTGAGTLVLESANTYVGINTVNEGTLLAANTTGFATGPGGVLVSDTGVLGGDGSVGQLIAFSGGTVAPGGLDGDDFAILSVERLLLNVDGQLEIDLGGTTPGSLHDQLQVSLDANLQAGVLEIDLADGYSPSIGDSFVIIEAAGSIDNSFVAITGDTLPNGLVFEVLYSSNAVTIEVAASFLPGDYNNDGLVDAADYTLWRDNVGAPAGTLVNDVDGGVIGEAQYQTWVTNFGQSLLGETQAVPEPMNLVGIAIVIGLSVRARRFRRDISIG